MPLVRVSLRRGKPAAIRKAILDGIYRAMRAAFDVPEEDRFMAITSTTRRISLQPDLSRHRAQRRSGPDPDHRQQHAAERKEEGALSARSSRTSRPIPACVRRMCSSTSSRCCRKTGRSETASRNTPPTKADGRPSLPKESSHDHRPLCPSAARRLRRSDHPQPRSGARPSVRRHSRTLLQGVPAARTRMLRRDRQRVFLALSLARGPRLPRFPGGRPHQISHQQFWPPANRDAVRAGRAEGRG